MSKVTQLEDAGDRLAPVLTIMLCGTLLTPHPTTGHTQEPSTCWTMQDNKTPALPKPLSLLGAREGAMTQHRPVPSPWAYSHHGRRHRV